MLPCSYIYNDEISYYLFRQDHPMKPKRIKMTHSLVEDFQLMPRMRVFHGRKATKEEMCEFHHPNYIQYLYNWVTPDPQAIVKQFYSSSMPTIPKQKLTQSEKFNEMYKINTTFDCPGFEGLYNFCELSVGGSLDAADLIITGESHFAVNWGGGYHHAKKSQASGFCYVNDIVVCILELLKVYPRVLYIDIDVHHGDGVEEAFFHTNRVMTVSFHQYEDDFFPGTGDVTSIGQGYGKYYTVNIPLRKGINDIMYINIFKKVISLLMNSYRPDVVVFQSGADSLSKDRIGNFDLSISAYGECVKFMKDFNVPMILLGGGGYTVENVARCWAYETSVLLNENIGNQISKTNEFAEYYSGDDYKLHYPVSGLENLNQQKELDRNYQIIAQHIRQAEIRPSIVFHYAPKHFLPGNELEWKMVDENEESLEQENLFKSFK